MDPTTVTNLRDLALAYLSLLGCIFLLIPLAGFSLAFVSLGKLQKKLQYYLRALYQWVVRVEKTSRGISRGLERLAKVVSRLLSRVGREKGK